MKVWLLYPYTTPKGNNAFGWFSDEFARRGMELEVYFWGVEGIPKSSLLSADGTVVPLDKHRMPDGAIIRGYNSGLSMWFEMRRKKVVNCCKSMEWSRDKVATARLLEAAGIPVPRTVTYLAADGGGRGEADSDNMLRKPAGAPFITGVETVVAPASHFGSDTVLRKPAVAPSYQTLEHDFGGQPFVMKLTFGSKGEDVFLVENESQYRDALASASRTAGARREAFLKGGGRWTEVGAWMEEVEHGCEPLFQEFVPQSAGKDLRVWVVGGHVAGAVLRHNSNSFKSNFAQGGDVSPYPVPSAATEIAVAATKCLGLDFAGVDLLFTGNGGFTVCEINGNAGFRTSSLVGGMDIPGVIADLFV